MRDFLPFGEDVVSTVGNRAGVTGYSSQDTVRQKFPSYQKDAETSLDFAEARMYANTFGRFTAVDPLLASGKSANPQTFNRYTYVLNNPLLLTDPDGLQVAMAAGKVYQKGDSFAIFRNKPFAGYKPVRRTIHTQTTINGVQHHLTVTPRGWEVGDRVDGAKFEAPPEPAKPVIRDERIQRLAGGMIPTWNAGVSGIGKGTANGVISLLNANTFTTLTGYGIPRFTYSNAGQASYAGAAETGVLLGTVVAGGVFTAGSSSSLSVVPEGTILPRYLYAYTSPETATIIQRAGQLGRVDELTYATNAGDLTPIRAQLDLALPQSNSAQSIFRIDTSLINQEPLLVRPVTGNVNSRPGGGVEYIFGSPFRRGSFTRIQ